MFKKLSGIIGDLLKIGMTGNAIKNHVDGLAVRNNADDANKNLVVARPQGSNKDLHAGTFADVKERVVLVEFSFNGASPPAGGANTGKYGLCHTSDGSYNAGELYYDDGSNLTLVTPYKMQVIMTKVAVAGTVNLIDEGLYIAESAAAPYSWTLKGDGTPVYTGVERVIEVPVTAAAGNFDASTAVPEGAVITRVSTKVSTAFDGSATLAVLIHGSSDLTVQTTSENTPSSAGTYETGDYEAVTASYAGVPRVTLGGSPSVGAAKVYVHYATPFA